MNLPLQSRGGADDSCSANDRLGGADLDPLTGFTIGITAARRREEFGAALQRRGASVLYGPAIQIVPVEDDDALRDVTLGCLASPPDIIVATTGIGFRAWIEAADGWGVGEKLLEQMGRASLLALRAAGATVGGVASAGSDASFDVMNAGGVLGWHGMAVLGVGQSNKVFIIDAQSHKVVTAITNEGAFHERTDPSKYPNLRESHAIVFTKDFKRMFTVSAFTYEVSTVIEYDPNTLREVGRVDAGVGSHHIALTPDDEYLYVAN